MAPTSRLFTSFAAALLYSAVALTPVMAAEASNADSTAYKAGETAGNAWQSGKEAARKAWGATKETTGEVTREVKEGWKDGTK